MLHELERMERRLCGGSAVQRTTVSLDEILDAVLELHRARGHVFTWKPTGSRVVGRQDAIAEALNILLENAATHGLAAPGRVDVLVDDTDDPLVVIEISDDGPGVPPEMGSRIFEWGQRGPHSGGEGIGLNLARRLVTEQGGTLTLTEVDQGACFAIRLPAARASVGTR
jgi:signal transduction histidine kinase